MKRDLPTARTIAVPAAPRTVGITREMVYARTRELAVQAGRKPLQISSGDYARARVELTGETDMDRQEAVLDARPAA
jgi:hypothetical protein